MGKGPVFGLNIGDLLGTYDRDLQSWKTSALSLFEDSTECLDRLPKSGMMRNGRIYEQATWVRRTEGKGYGLSLIPTPTSSDADQGAILNENTHIVFLKSGKPRKISNQGVSGSVGLARYYQIMLPTPTVTIAKNNTMSLAQEKRESSLINEVNKSMLRTPDANMAKRGPKSYEGYQDSQKNGTHAINLNDQSRHEFGMKRLNPELPEWMMGYPANWTRIDYEDAEMLSCHK